MVTREERAARRAELAKQAVQLYEEERFTLMQVAEKLEISYGKAHQLVKEAGGTLRKRGGQSKK